MEKNLWYVSFTLYAQGDLWMQPLHEGDVVHITIMGQPTVILGSIKAASDLLDARGTICLHLFSNISHWKALRTFCDLRYDLFRQTTSNYGRRTVGTRVSSVRHCS